MNSPMKAVLLASILSLVSFTAVAQPRVHALSGTVTAIHTKAGFIQFNTDDGSSGHFALLRVGDGAVQFDKSVRADSVSAEKFSALKCRAIMYFIQQGDERVAIALRGLGDDPVEVVTGTVVKLNRRDHLLTIRNAAGVDELFQMEPNTVIDKAIGVEQGLKVDLEKGDAVRITAARVAGADQALLIAPAL